MKVAATCVSRTDAASTDHQHQADERPGLQIGLLSRTRRVSRRHEVPFTLRIQCAELEFGTACVLLKAFDLDHCATDTGK